MGPIFNTVAIRALLFIFIAGKRAAECFVSFGHLAGSSVLPLAMVDVFLVVSIVVAVVILLIVSAYVLIHYQHPDDHNDAYFPKLVVTLGFCLAGATVLMLPLDVANNGEFRNKYQTQIFHKQ